MGLGLTLGLTLVFLPAENAVTDLVPFFFFGGFFRAAVAFRRVAVRRIALLRVALRCIASRCISLRYIALHYFALRFFLFSFFFSCGVIFKKM